MNTSLKTLGAGLIGAALATAGCQTNDMNRATLPTGGGDLMLAIDRQGPDKVRVGEEFTYQIRVRNTTDQPIHNVRVMETIQGRPVELVRSDPSAAEGEYLNPWLQTQHPRNGDSDRMRVQEVDFEDERDKVPFETVWTLGHLDPNESRTIRVTSLADDSGAIRSCLTADYDLSVCTTMQAVAPDMRMNRIVADGRSEVYACEPINVTYAITNTGGATTRPTTVVEELPDGVATRQGDDRVRIQVEPIRPGQTVEKTVLLQAEGARTFKSRATATSGQLEITSRASQIRILNPELEMTLDGPADEYLGRPLTYEVSIKNTSDAPAKDVILTTTLDQRARNVSLSSQQARRDGDAVRIGTIAPGETRTLAYTFDPADIGSMRSSFTMSAHCVPEQTKRIQTNVVGVPAVLLEVVDKIDPVRVGENTVYEVTVTNQGTAPGLNIRLHATPPPELEFLRSDGDTRDSVTMSGDKLVFEPIPSLDPGDSMSWNLHFRAKSAERVRLQVKMSSDVTERPIIEQESTTITK